MKSTIDNLQKTDSVNIHNKKIVSTTAGFGLLRKALIENLGIKRAKVFLLRYGWDLGVSDAEEAMKVSKSLEFLIKQATILHLNTGYISDIVSERIIEMNDSETIKSIFGKGKWINSFEAREHLKHHGQADSPVCSTLTGYASGYMSTILKQKIVVKETHCFGMGHSECEFEMKFNKDSGNEIHDDLDIHNEMNIIDELEYTYEQLLEQRNYIEKVAKFHNRLTESISNGSNLQDIVDTIFKSLNIPVSIEDVSFQKIVFAGVTEEEYIELNKDIVHYLKQKIYKNTNSVSLLKETIRLKTGIQDRIIAPIIVQKKIIGYCTFFDIKEKSTISENDVMFIERSANAASLYLLNEKTSFDVLEKMKGYLLEQILRGQYTSKEEVINRGRHMGFDLESSFYIVAFDYNEKGKVEKNKPGHFDRFLETVITYLDIQGYKALIGQHEGRIVMLVPKTENLINKLEKILNHVETSFPNYQYHAGISDEDDDIDVILELFDQSVLALSMSNRKKITNFKELGIIGILVSSKNVNGIKKIAKQELGPLYDFEDDKKKDLIKTLYVFLANGGKLHQTMDDLSLSLSGLMYRVNKIKKMLNKELRDPVHSYHLLLILDSLIALGELDI